MTDSSINQHLSVIIKAVTQISHITHAIEEAHATLNKVIEKRPKPILHYENCEHEYLYDHKHHDSDDDDDNIVTEDEFNHIEYHYVDSNLMYMEKILKQIQDESDQIRSKGLRLVINHTYEYQLYRVSDTSNTYVIQRTHLNKLRFILNNSIWNKELKRFKYNTTHGRHQDTELDPTKFQPNLDLLFTFEVFGFEPPGNYFAQRGPLQFNYNPSLVLLTFQSHKLKFNFTGGHYTLHFTHDIKNRSIQPNLLIHHLK